MTDSIPKTDSEIRSQNIAEQTQALIDCIESAYEVVVEACVEGGRKPYINAVLSAHAHCLGEAIGQIPDRRVRKQTADLMFKVIKMRASETARRGGKKNMEIIQEFSKAGLH